MSAEHANERTTTAALTLLITFASQVVVVSAVLYYFGYVRTKTLFAYFGLDASLLGYGSTDYMLHSVNTALQPIAGGALAVLLLYGAHRRLVSRCSPQPTLHRLRLACTGGGAVLGTVALTGLVWPQIAADLGWALPLMLIAAAVLLAYGEHLRVLRVRGRGGISARGAAILLSLGLVGTIWMLALYAQELGLEAALTKQGSLPTEPEVVLYSAYNLHLAGQEGVKIEPLGIDGAHYRFKYADLRLLDHTAGKYILLPAEWRPDHGSIFVVPDNDSIRADVVVRHDPTPEAAAR